MQICILGAEIQNLCQHDDLSAWILKILQQCHSDVKPKIDKLTLTTEIQGPITSTNRFNSLVIRIVIVHFAAIESVVHLPGRLAY
jgi:hypothetical protein